MIAKAYRGRGGWLAMPFLTIEDDKAYEGQGGWLADPIATVQGGGRMSAACAAVYLLMM